MEKMNFNEESNKVENDKEKELKELAKKMDTAVANNDIKTIKELWSAVKEISGILSQVVLDSAKKIFK